MAVDSKAKRFSILNYDDVGAATILIDADAAALVSQDMYHLLGLYSGIDLDAPSDVVVDREPLVTKLDVFNIAALALGFAEGVSDPDENTAVASVLRRRWTTARRSFMEEHSYNGIKRTAILSKKTTAPVDRWCNMFGLPYDTLRVLTINGINQSDGTDAWEMEFDVATNERVILTDASTVKAALIVDVPDLTHLKAKVIEAMGLYLAYQVNEVFPMSPQKRKDMKEKMDHAVSMAKGTDGQEGTPPRRSQSWLVDARKNRRGGRRR